MKQKAICGIVLSCILIVLFGWGEQLTNIIFSKTMGVSLKTEAELLPMLENLTFYQGDSRNILFNGEAVPYDEESNTIYISQNSNTPKWEGSFSSLQGTLYFEDALTSENKSTIIADNQSIDLYLIWEDGYTKFDVVFSGLPIMTLSTDYSSMLLMNPKDASLPCQTAKCNVNVRGRTSSGYEKQGYSLQLTDGKQSLLGMRTDEDWILNALYDDAGLVHNALSYELWNQIAAANSIAHDNTTRQKYIELIYDNTYLGVYALTERIDQKELSLNNSHILYKVIAWPDESENPYDAFALKWPKNASHRTEDVLITFAEELWLNDNRSFARQQQLLFYENALDYNLFCLLTVGMDNTLKNSFLLAEEQTDGSYKILELPWDMNASWGSEWSLSFHPEYITNTDCWSFVGRELFAQNPQQVAADLKQRWSVLRQDILTEENLHSILDDNFALLYESGAYERNYNKWPDYCLYWLEENNRFPVETVWRDEYIYDFVTGRITFLDQFLTELSLQPDIFLGEATK